MPHGMTQGATEGGWHHRGRMNDYAFAHEFDDAPGLAALADFEGKGRSSVVGDEARADLTRRQGARGERGSTIGGAGGFAAGAAGDAASEDLAF
eukprot:SAG11_NODE_16597_length_543_cov_0.903153_1_plen_94_part_00